MYFSGTNPRQARVQEQVPVAAAGWDKVLSKCRQSCMQNLLGLYCGARYPVQHRGGVEKMSHRQIALCWFGTGRCLSPRRPGPQPQAQWKACILVCWHQHGLVCKHNPQGASQGIVVDSRPAASSMASKLTRSDSNFYRLFGDPMALAWPSPALVCACTITSRRSASSPSPNNLVCATFNRSRPANWLPTNWVLEQGEEGKRVSY